MHWLELAESVLIGKEISDEDALKILTSDDGDLLAILHASYQIRKHYYGNKVKLNMIINAKSGLLKLFQC
jgi:biotin synthase